MAGDRPTLSPYRLTYEPENETWVLWEWAPESAAWHTPGWYVVYSGLTPQRAFEMVELLVGLLDAAGLAAVTAALAAREGEQHD